MYLARMSITITPELLERLDKAAIATGHTRNNGRLNRSSAVCCAVEEFVMRPMPPRPQDTEHADGNP